MTFIKVFNVCCQQIERAKKIENAKNEKIKIIETNNNNNNNNNNNDKDSIYQNDDNKNSNISNNIKLDIAIPKISKKVKNKK